MKITTAALEVTSITRFNEKMVRRYQKEFYDNKGHFKEERTIFHKGQLPRIHHNFYLRCATCSPLPAVAVKQSGQVAATQRKLLKWPSYMKRRSLGCKFQELYIPDLYKSVFQLHCRVAVQHTNAWKYIAIIYRSSS